MENIKGIAAGNNFTAGLLVDGTVLVTTSKIDYGNAYLNEKEGILNVCGWTNISSLQAAGNFVIGLKQDGSAVAAVQLVREIGKDSPDETIVDLSAWTDIKSVSVSPNFAVGLKQTERLLRMICTERILL